jgi:ribose transport system permease protein
MTPPLSGMLGRLAPAISLVLVAALFYAIAPNRPLTGLDVRFILLQTVIVGLVALGMTVVIVSGGIDLSVGSSVAWCGVAAAKMMAGGDSELMPVLAVLAAALVGVACGLYNGALITLLRLPPFIVTLGTLGFFRGVAKWASGSSPVYSKPGWLTAWVDPSPRGSMAWLLVAPVVWVLLIIAGIVALVLKQTVAGRHAVAIGSNEEASRRAGIPIARVKIAVYAACGLLVGLAGVVQFARLGGSGDPTIQVGLELKAIAAVVIGGASFAGGYASVTGTLCGAMLMVLLENRCTAVGWPNYVQELVVGHIIIAAVALDQWRRRRAGGAVA